MSRSAAASAISARQAILAGNGRRTHDLSIGFLSQIERGLSSPSLRVLATSADVLGVGIAACSAPAQVPTAVRTRS
jgi:transcriptional regulator with XRE-family HTH domain